MLCFTIRPLESNSKMNRPQNWVSYSYVSLSCLLILLLLSTRWLLVALVVSVSVLPDVIIEVKMVEVVNMLGVVFVVEAGGIEQARHLTMYFSPPPPGPEDLTKCSLKVSSRSLSPGKRPQATGVDQRAAR